MRPGSKLVAALVAVALASAPHLPVGYFDPLDRPIRRPPPPPTSDDIDRLSAAEAKRARRAARRIRSQQ